MTNALSLRPGDRVPDFALPGLDGKLRKFIWSFTGAPWPCWRSTTWPISTPASSPT